MKNVKLMSAVLLGIVVTLTGCAGVKTDGTCALAVPQGCISVYQNGVAVPIAAADIRYEGLAKKGDEINGTTSISLRPLKDHEK